MAAIQIVVNIQFDIFKIGVEIVFTQSCALPFQPISPLSFFIFTVIVSLYLFRIFISQKMIRLKQNYLLSKVMLLAIMLLCFFLHAGAQSGEKAAPLSNKIEGAEQINPTTVQLIFTDKHCLTIDFYGENIFRVFEDTSVGIVREPESMPPANILVENPGRPVGRLTIMDDANRVTIASAKISIEIEKNTSLFKFKNYVK